MSTPATISWLTLGSVLGFPLVIIWLAWLSHRAVSCPHCGLRGRYYVGFFSDLRTRARDIGPVYCKHCHARFVFIA